MSYTNEYVHQLHVTVEELKSQLQKAKVQESDLQKIKNICSTRCGSCIFFNQYSTGCLFKAYPYSWDIDFILEKLKE